MQKLPVRTMEKILQSTETRLKCVYVDGGIQRCDVSMLFYRILSETRADPVTYVYDTYTFDNVLAIRDDSNDIGQSSDREKKDDIGDENEMFWLWVHVPCSNLCSMGI